ncbi:hypothetical protein [Bacillus anthracis]|uniref:hypothetical protein n=1 Tax=Bacillus anthracis TaxID=1392 RepID=UPI000538BE43|nr:hypothetical protein [Bacillus anthracis]KGZ73351.1 hypothetical protein OY24_03200 [Bacillus anthracis]HDR5535153.1 hypothetical protein [Bacillus anthracis]
MNKKRSNTHVNKNEDSQLSSENGMLIALAVIIVLVIGPFVWKAIQGVYDTILARFTKASSNADVNSWNK